MILEKFKSPSIVVLILVLCQTWSLLAAAPALPLPANYHFYNSLPPPPPAKRFADKGKYKSKIFVGKERAQHEVEPCDGGSWGFCCDVFASLVYFAKCPANSWGTCFACPFFIPKKTANGAPVVFMCYILIISPLKSSHNIIYSHKMITAGKNQ